VERLWRCRDLRLEWGRRTLVMGIVNVTPDSFSDGGAHATAEAALAHARRLARDGADILDVGGESTRPGAADVSAEDEKARVVPVIRALAREMPGLALSVDTRKAAVAEAALEAGAHVVNDVTAGRLDPRILDVAGAAGAGVVLMHMPTTSPATMQAAARYDDVVAEVREHLLDRALAATAAGVRRDAIAVDPGIGFGKLLEHNLSLIRALPHLTSLGFPVLMGVSRKSFLARLTERGGETPPPLDRREATVAAETACILGGAAILRTHDVKAARRASAVADALTPREATP